MLTFVFPSKFILRNLVQIHFDLISKKNSVCRAEEIEDISTQSTPSAISTPAIAEETSDKVLVALDGATFHDTPINWDESSNDGGKTTEFTTSHNLRVTKRFLTTEQVSGNLLVLLSLFYCPKMICRY